MVGSEYKLRTYLKISITIIIVLLLVIVYFLIARPQLQGYVIRKQIEAQQTAIQTILQIVQQQGYIQIGQGNNSVILVPFNPNQAQEGQQLQG